LKSHFSGRKIAKICPPKFIVHAPFTKVLTEDLCELDIKLASAYPSSKFS